MEYKNYKFYNINYIPDSEWELFKYKRFLNFSHLTEIEGEFYSCLHLLPSLLNTIAKELKRWRNMTISYLKEDKG